MSTSMYCDCDCFCSFALRGRRGRVLFCPGRDEICVHGLPSFYTVLLPYVCVHLDKDMCPPPLLVVITASCRDHQHHDSLCLLVYKLITRQFHRPHRKAFFCPEGKSCVFCVCCVCVCVWAAFFASSFRRSSARSRVVGGDPSSGLVPMLVHRQRKN